jgi:hypothetical protein
MPRIIVTTDPATDPDTSVLLDELVQSVHLSTGFAAAQLVERIAWAISDAEAAELDTRAVPARPLRRRAPAAARRGADGLRQKPAANAIAA